MAMKLAIGLAAARLVASHATFQSIVVDGEDQGQHFAVQSPSNANNPIYDVSSSSMTCNGGTAVSDFVEVAAGSSIGLQWHHNDPMTESGDNDEPIAESHHGPVMVYIAEASTNGEGAVWTKIFEDGLSGGVWGIDTFRANKGLITIDLPDLADGEYLIRPELIALHEASAEMKAQFYNGCGQLKITGGSVSLPASGTDMTKAYSATDPGVLVDIYNNPTSYEIPGPAVWDGASSGGGSAEPTSASPSTTAAATSAAASSAAPSSAAPSSAAPSSPATTTTPTAPATTSAPASGGASSTCTGQFITVTASSTSAAASATPSDIAVDPVDEGSGSGSALPSSFTVDELVSYIEENARTVSKPNRFSQFVKWISAQAKASSKVRRHARAFAV